MRAAVTFTHANRLLRSLNFSFILCIMSAVCAHACMNYKNMLKRVVLSSLSAIMPKAKKKSKRVGEPQAAQDHLDLGDMNLESFKFWSPEALKSFLALRGKSITGTFEELAAR